MDVDRNTTAGKCRVTQCQENHLSHFCKACKQNNVDHFSWRCPTKTKINDDGNAEGKNKGELKEKGKLNYEGKVIKRKEMNLDGKKKDIRIEDKIKLKDKKDKLILAEEKKKNGTKTNKEDGKNMIIKKRKSSDIEEANDNKAPSTKKKTLEASPSPKKKFSKLTKSIRCVGEGPLKSLMLAKNYETDFSTVKGWLMSEKLDGVRCYWTGSEMFTRTGKPFYPPDWFLRLLPRNLALDGELWTKRDDFQAGVSIVRCQDKNARDWTKITYMVYDAPLLVEKFVDRLEIIGQILHNEDRSEIEQKHVKLHKHKVCKTEEYLLEKAEKVFSLNGEGLMLKDPNCAYETKRSGKLLKVKKFDDAEAVVIAHIQGTGRCSTMLGALQVKDMKGNIFKVGSGFSDAQRRKPPRIGTTITFKYQGTSKAGIPRFPIYLREHPGM